MKTFASILLLLASGQAAGQSAKAVKTEMSIANIELLGSVSAEAIELPEADIELPRVIELSGAKSAKAKAGKAKAGKMGDAKAEKESSSSKQPNDYLVLPVIALLTLQLQSPNNQRPPSCSRAAPRAPRHTTPKRARNRPRAARVRRVSIRSRSSLAGSLMWTGLG